MASIFHILLLCENSRGKKLFLLLNEAVLWPFIPILILKLRQFDSHIYIMCASKINK